MDVVASRRGLQNYDRNSPESTNDSEEQDCDYFLGLLLSRWHRDVVPNLNGREST